MCGKNWEAIGKNAHAQRMGLHIDDHQLSREDFETRRELHENCAEIVLT